MDQYINYKLAKAKSYLHKAKNILAEVDLLNSKLEGSFYAIDDVFTIHEMYRREAHDRRINDYDQGRRGEETESTLFDI